MPYIQITVAGAPLSEAERRQLHQLFTDEVHRLLHKRREVTAVAIAEVPSDRWAIDGEACAARAAHAEILITAGTNSATEKAALIAAADAGLRTILGPLPEATYVVIREMAADAWGYGGRTQQARLGARAAL